MSQSQSRLWIIALLLLGGGLTVGLVGQTRGLFFILAAAAGSTPGIFGQRVASTAGARARRVLRLRRTPLRTGNV